MLLLKTIIEWKTLFFQSKLLQLDKLDKTFIKLQFTFLKRKKKQTEINHKVAYILYC